MVFNVSWNGEHNLSASMLNYRMSCFFIMLFLLIAYIWLLIILSHCSLKYFMVRTHVAVSLSIISVFDSMYPIF